ncbi:MAG: hypothetical protein KAY83_04085, partial [Agitococcus sp.]|nr:hypothetical protein [Agitococcus sp.]
GGFRATALHPRPEEARFYGNLDKKATHSGLVMQASNRYDFPFVQSKQNSHQLCKYVSRLWLLF